MNIDQIAEICHEANRAICEASGDMSQVSWGQTSEDIRMSALAGIRGVLSNPRVTPEEHHQTWVDYKIAHGWKYGESKNAELKTHPLIVPFEELLITDKIKDFVSIRLALVCSK